jgi:ABC-type phosphate transport system ATPase subunit
VHSDRTAFLDAEPAEGTGDRTGLLVEYDRTDAVFTHPADKRTEDYITVVSGRGPFEQASPCALDRHPGR